MNIETELRCESCHEPHGGNIGDPCDEACQHSRLVHAIESGRYCVEVGAGPDGGYLATGLIGENLSREYGVRDYKTFKGAERSALKWIARKTEGDAS